MTKRLENGESFPSIQIKRVGGGSLDLPADFAGNYGVILVYRGLWCPFCNEQLAAFAQAFEALSEAGIKVVALSADNEANAAAMAHKHSIPFDIGHTADISTIVETTGAYETRSPVQGHFLENTGFLLDPDGLLVTSVYSSRAIGRLAPGDVIRVVAFMRQQLKK